MTGTHGTGHTAGLGGTGTGITGTHGTGHTAGYDATGTGITGTHGTGHTPGYGPTGTGITGTHGAAGTHPHGGLPEHKTRGILHRSGSSSSSSSSSEDDGMGGRRKKGMKQKIKEKLPGGNKEQTTATGGYGPGYTGTTGTGGPGYTGTTGTGGTYGTTEGTHEKKGVMEKIKEKLPGGHKDTQPHTTATGGYGHGTTGTGGGYGTGTTGTAGTHGATEGTHEKKGMMEKIKEKLPGGHH